MSHTPLAKLLIAFPLLIAPAAAFPQAMEGTLTLPSEVSVRGVGWSQIKDFAEISDFLVAVFETLIFVAAFAFHPRANAARQDIQNWHAKASLFLFGLIGMLVGFLVLHHGYLIGFVVFGLGSLFRFRMASSSLMDGAILIMVTLVGLSVGLDLPVMALIATITGFITLWFVTATRTLVVELKFGDEEALRAALSAATEAFERRGFKIMSTRKTGFKSVVEYVLSHKDSDATSAVLDVMDELNEAGHAAKDWHVA